MLCRTLQNVSVYVFVCQCVYVRQRICLKISLYSGLFKHCVGLVFAVSSSICCGRGENRSCAKGLKGGR